MLNTNQTLCSQYANSPSMLQLIANMNAYMDPRENMIAFYDYVWNVDTAQNFGLDYWGRIVGVSRVIPIPGTAGSFGFDNEDTPPDWENFGSVGQPGVGGPFFAGEATTGGYTLNDTSFRTLILTKALANICATTAPALNQLIQNLFPGRGRAYTIDRGKSNASAGGMQMAYVFEFALSSIEYAILAYSGVLPHPAGVQVSVIVVPAGTFGFNEQGTLVEPFNFGVFYLPPASL
jgi:Protein of unknown function (DUF2612)